MCVGTDASKEPTYSRSDAPRRSLFDTEHKFIMLFERSVITSRHV